MTHHAVTLGVKPCLRVECKFWLGDDGWNGRSERPAIAVQASTFEQAKSDMEIALGKYIESLLRGGRASVYASDGFLMARSGPARGISEIRKALAEYVAMKPTIQLTTRRVVQVGAPPCLWQIGDFTEPPAMAEMCQPLAPVSKSLVANRTGVGVTSSTFPTGSVNPLAEN